MRIRLARPGQSHPYALLPNGGDGTDGATTGGAATATTGQAGTQTATTSTGGTDTGAGDDGQPAVGPNGFPLNLPWRDMRPEHQAAYWRHQSQRHENEAKTNKARITELEPAAAQIEALREASKTEAERAVEQARKDGETAGREAAAAEARRVYGAQLVNAKLEGAAAGKGMTPAALAVLAGDPARFLGAEGVDTEALDAFLAAVPGQPAQQQGGARIDLGGGNRQPVKVGGLQAGADLWDQRHKGKSTT